MKLHRTCIAILALAAVSPAFPQQSWTLSQCVEHAVAHNIGVKQMENARALQEVQLSTDRNSRLPDLNASASQNFSFGRSLTAQNTYENQNTGSTSFSIGTSVPLFTGNRIPNNIKLGRLNLEAAAADLEKARNDIGMQVAQAYTQILYAAEIWDVANRQISIDSMQVVRLRAMVKNGKASETDLSQQQATLAKSRLTATTAYNDYQLALLTLTQLLELPDPHGFSIVRPDIEKICPEDNLPLSPDAVYAEALGLKPEVRAQQLRVGGADYSVKIARSALYPQLSFSAGLGSNYYKTSGYDSDSFSAQMKNHFSQYFGLNLSVPLFNRLSTRNGIRSARIEQANQKLKLEDVKKTLYKEIQLAYYNLVAAVAKYRSSEQAMQSSEQAFLLTQAKYENGKANITEFNEAKNAYLNAQSDMTQARYEYLYQSNLLDFYRGKPFMY